MAKLKVKKMRVVFKIDQLYLWVKEKLSERFYKFGVMVGVHPVWFSVVPLFLSLALGVGILRLHQSTDTERLFTPVGSQIFTDRHRIKDLFPDTTGWNFDAFGLIEIPTMAVFIFRRGGKDKVTQTSFYTADVSTDQQKYNIFDVESSREIEKVMKELKAITVEGKNYTVDDLCARVRHRCVVDGELYTTEAFRKQVAAGAVDYPAFKINNVTYRELSLNVAGIKVDKGKMVAARMLKIRFYWRVDQVEIAKLWNLKYLEYWKKTEMNLKADLDVAYSTSESLENELVAGTSSDAVLFAGTLLLMSAYSVLVSSGGDVVSTRALLACGGVLSAILGVVSSLGFLCLVGAEFVNFVGIMPFLVLGIGVDDMFLLMTAWGESFEYYVGVPERVGLTFSKAGISITITTLTDVLAFIIGTSSSFLVVRQFCLFTALAMLMCYVINVTLFGACMSLHGDRVFSTKHCLTCKPTKTREEIREAGGNVCKVYCCGGSVPTHPFEDESLCERAPRYILPRLILHPVCKIVVLLAFLAYLGAAVYGATQLKFGMKYVDLVLRSSYYYKFSTWDHDYFGERLAIAFVVDHDINYGGEEGDQFRKMLNEAQRDPALKSTFLRCWLHQYSRSVFYPPSQQTARNKTLFTQGLRRYLPYDLMNQNDVIFDKTNSTVVASRCYLLSKSELGIFDQSEMMVRLRNLVAAQEYPVLVFQPVFVALEHTQAILPSTLQTIGTAVAVMFLVTLMMLPQILMVSLVTLNIIFIITCVFGFMYFLDVSFSGIAMIHILMSVGFSVDFSAHICAAYLMSDSPGRVDRARYALVHASGPIFNGGLSSLVGVSMLMLSESYFFRTFFWIMCTVISAGAVNSVFFMPIILSYIGPENPPQAELFAEDLKRRSIIPRRPSNVTVGSSGANLSGSVVRMRSSLSRAASAPTTGDSFPKLHESTEIVSATKLTHKTVKIAPQAVVRDSNENRPREASVIFSPPVVVDTVIDPAADVAAVAVTPEPRAINVADVFSAQSQSADNGTNRAGRTPGHSSAVPPCPASKSLTVVGVSASTTSTTNDVNDKGGRSTSVTSVGLQPETSALTSLTTVDVSSTSKNTNDNRSRSPPRAVRSPPHGDAVPRLISLPPIKNTGSGSGPLVNDPADDAVVVENLNIVNIPSASSFTGTFVRSQCSADHHVGPVGLTCFSVVESSSTCANTILSRFVHNVDQPADLYAPQFISATTNNVTDNGCRSSVNCAGMKPPTAPAVVSKSFAVADTISVACKTHNTAMIGTDDGEPVGDEVCHRSFDEETDGVEHITTALRHTADHHEPGDIKVKFSDTEVVKDAGQGSKKQGDQVVNTSSCVTSNEGDCG